MTVVKVKGIKKFKKGMCFKSTYRWHGEPTKTYYYKVINPKYDGKGADTKIFKLKKDGKSEKLNQDSFMWNYETQIGRVNNPEGWGRSIPTKC